MTSEKSEIREEFERMILALLPEMTDEDMENWLENKESMRRYLQHLAPPKRALSEGVVILGVGHVSLTHVLHELMRVSAEQCDGVEVMVPLTTLEKIMPNQESPFIHVVERCAYDLAKLYSVVDVVEEPWRDASFARPPKSMGCCRQTQTVRTSRPRWLRGKQPYRN